MSKTTPEFVVLVKGNWDNSTWGMVRPVKEDNSWMELVFLSRSGSTHVLCPLHHHKVTNFIYEPENRPIPDAISATMVA